MSRDRWLVIFVKEPVAGRVKTRLAQGIGTVPAAWWFRHQVDRLVRMLHRDPRWRTVLAVSPDTAVDTRMLPEVPRRIGQGHGNLGDRMGRVLRCMPPGPVVIVGGDIPGIQSSDIADAFAELGRAEAVLGPAKDGGYWLIGMNRAGRAVPTRLFEGVRWSTEFALADTEHGLRDLRRSRLRTLSDVDTATDLLPRDIRAGTRI